MEKGKTLTLDITKLVNAYTVTQNKDPSTLAYFKGSGEMSKFIRSLVDPEIKTRAKKVVNLDKGKESDGTVTLSN